MIHGPSPHCCIVTYFAYHLFLSFDECEYTCEKVVVSFLFNTLKAFVI